MHLQIFFPPVYYFTEKVGHLKTLCIKRHVFFLQSTSEIIKIVLAFYYRNYSLSKSKEINNPSSFNIPEIYCQSLITITKLTSVLFLSNILLIF